MWDAFGQVVKVLSPTTLVSAEKIFSLGIFEGTAGNEIDPNQNHNCNNQNYVGFSPFVSQVSQQTSFARAAIVAELTLVVAPQEAVRVPCWVHRV